MRRVMVGLVVLACGCREKPPVSSAVGGADSVRQPAFEPPVVTNAESPVRYPPATFQKSVEGTVVLRLFVDSLGRLAPEST